VTFAGLISELARAATDRSRSESTGRAGFESGGMSGEWFPRWRCWLMGRLAWWAAAPAVRRGQGAVSAGEYCVWDGGGAVGRAGSRLRWELMPLIAC